MRLAPLLGGITLACAAALPPSPPQPIRAFPIIMIHPQTPDLRPLVIIEIRLDDRPIRICAGGDVMLGSDLDTSWAIRRGVRALPDPFALMAPLRPLVADADIVLLNVEGAIGSGVAPPKCRPGSTSCYAFRQPPVAASALRSVSVAGAVVGTVANNHAMDAGAAGFAETVRELERAGVFATGHDTLPTLVALPGGDTIAFLGFSTFQAGPSARDLVGVHRHVRRSAARWRTVVTVHHGAEGVRAQRTADATERFLGEDRGNPVAFARTAVQAGAVAVFGHGPHVLRGAAWVRDRPVIHSLGNLLTYGPFNLAEPLNRGGFACVTLNRFGNAMAVDFRSTMQVPPGVVQPDPTSRSAILIDSLGRLDFGSNMIRIH
ncbi:MAG: CapA family protein [Gemmatimonadales bacterium]